MEREGLRREGNHHLDIDYNAQTKQWTPRPTRGSPPPGSYYGGCTSIENHLYCFGGRDGSLLFNDLHKLNLETFQWSKVYPSNSSLSECPSQKNTCGFIAKDERTLACFGGWAVDPMHSGERTWSNEFHLFHTQEGNLIVRICTCKYLRQLIQSHTLLAL